MTPGEGDRAAARRGIVAHVVAVGCMGLLPAGAAARERTATEYGGGLLSRVTVGTYDPSVGVSLRDLGGGSMRYRLTTTVRCRDAGVFDVAVAGIGTGSPSGFTVSARRRLKEYPRLRVVVRYRLALTFAGDRATGRLRITGTYRRGRGTRSCAAKPDRDLVLTARARAVGGPADPAPNALFAGLVDRRSDSTRYPVVIRANRTGRRIAARWELKAPCTGGGFERFVNFTPLTTISNARAVRRERFSVTYLRGVVVRYRMTFDARFRAGGVNGTVRLQATIRDRGRTVARCDSGPRAFSALPAG